LLRLAIKPVVLGKRIELLHIDNPYSDLKPGDRGTVVDVSELSYEDRPSKVWVLWDSSSRLTILEGHDDYKIVYKMTMPSSQNCMVMDDEDRDIRRKLKDENK
jgi:Domain of unknown function (DUF4314)